MPDSNLVPGGVCLNVHMGSDEWHVPGSQGARWIVLNLGICKTSIFLPLACNARRAGTNIAGR